MNFSKRLALIVSCTALGIIILIFIALHTIKASLVDDRRIEIDTIVSMAATSVNQFVKAEKDGSLTRQEAQKLAKQAISGMRSGEDYVFIREESGLVIVHPDKRKEGKVDMGSKGPDGRTLMQVYIDALKIGDKAFVEIKTKRPKGEVEVPKLNGLVKIPEWGWIVGFGLFVDDIDSAFKAEAIRFSIVGLLILGVVLFLAVTIARKMYTTLGGEPTSAAQLAKSIAAGDLSATSSLDAKEGSLIHSIVQMRNNLHSIIQHIQVSASSVRDASSGLSQQMGHITQASHAASDAVSSTSAAMEQLAVSVDHISQNAHDTHVNAERAAELATNGRNLVENASREVQLASSHVENATALIGGLVQQTRNIGGIVGSIKEIADQTNLLALNAAIEAARAGEQGRGFAVVADEVRKLAERTSLATDEITAMIGAINHDTEKVVVGMEAVGPQVARGVEIANEAGIALSKINDATSVALENVSYVTSATNEQSQASASVANSVEKIAAMLEESANSVTAANINVQSLAQLANDLKQSVSHFKV